MALGPFLATKECNIPRLLDLTDLVAADMVLDLSSGDGLLLKRLVNATGCRGIGIEADPVLHAQAEKHCATEVAQRSLLLLNTDVERLALNNLGQLLVDDSRLLKLAGRPVVPTITYAYTSNQYVRQSRRVIQLLQDLLRFDCYIATQNIELPDREIPLEARMVKRNPDDAEGIMELMSMSTVNGVFYLYRGTEQLTKTLVQLRFRRAQAEEDLAKKQRVLQQQSERLNHVQAQLDQAKVQRSNVVQDLAKLKDSENDALDVSLREQVAQRIAVAEQSLPTQDFSSHEDQHQLFNLVQEEILKLHRAEEEVMRERARRAEAAERKRLELEPPVASGWNAMKSACRSLPPCLQLGVDWNDLHASWECLECDESNGNAIGVCEFCESKRGSGRLVWARSEAEWEEREGDMHCAPQELEEAWETERIQRLAEQAETKRLEEEEHERLLVIQFKRQRFEGDLRKLKVQEDKWRQQADEDAQSRQSLGELRRQLVAIEARIDKRAAALHKPKAALTSAAEETNSLVGQLRTCQTHLDQARQAVHACTEEVALCRKLYNVEKEQKYRRTPTSAERGA